MSVAGFGGKRRHHPSSLSSVGTDMDFSLLSGYGSLLHLTADEAGHALASAPNGKAGDGG